MNYRFASFEIFVNEDLLDAGAPAWDNHGWTYYSVPFTFSCMGEASYSGTFWGSARDYVDNKLPNPVEVAAMVIHDITSAHCDPEEFVGMCSGRDTAEGLMQIARLLQFAERFGDELAAWLDAEDLWDDEDLEAYLKERGE